MATIYVYRTHLWSPFCQFQYQKLQADLGVENVYLLFDETVSKFTCPQNNVILTNFKKCLDINPLHRSNKEQVESQLLVLIQECPVDFEYLWLIEYDVYCNGNWKLLENCLEMNHDFLGTQVFNYPQKILWNYWFALYGPKRKKPLLQDRASSFFPLVRLSKKLLLALQENIGHYSGFCEVYIPTLAKQKGLTLQNIPTNLIGPSFYYDPIKKEQAKIENKDDNKFYHPVTDFPEF